MSRAWLRQSKYTTLYNRTAIPYGVAVFLFGGGGFFVGEGRIFIRVEFFCVGCVEGGDFLLRRDIIRCEGCGIFEMNMYLCTVFEKVR